MMAIFVILPLVIAAFIALLISRQKPRLIKYVALAGSVGSLLMIAMLYLNSSGQMQSTTWFGFSGYLFQISTSTMPLNMLLLAIVGVITPLIIIYSIGFMSVPSEQARYYFELCIFAAAMMLFAMSADFITMFIGWELLGVTSYLLIGFWYQRDGTPEAARKAITTILIGDVLMFLAILLIWNSYHTFSFALLLQQASTNNHAMSVALILIMIAAFTKSAQFPFHEWLPDAMKGPTPVSAFLHSSTMVKAGVFLVAALLPLFAAYHLLYLLLIFGIITCIIGITNAITELHIKRVLAYSTIEDLGLMFVALGSGSLRAAMILFVAQTFYKALLFMSAGSIIKANNGEEDMEKIYNSPAYLQLFIPTIIAVASLAGLFPLSGFFGKAAVDISANNLVIYSLLIFIGFLSNIYIFRWLFVPLHKKDDKKTTDARANYKTLPNSMLIPMYILAFLIVAGSIIFVYLPTYLQQYALKSFVLNTSEIIVLTLVFIGGLFVSYSLFYWRNYSAMEEESPIYKLLYNNLITNKAYLYVTKLVTAISWAVEAIDYSLYGIVKGGAHGVNAFANVLKKAETGNMNTYIAAFVIGLIIIVIIFIL